MQTTYLNKFWRNFRKILNFLGTLLIFQYSRLRKVTVPNRKLRWGIALIDSYQRFSYEKIIFSALEHAVHPRMSSQMIWPIEPNTRITCLKKHLFRLSRDQNSYNLEKYYFSTRSQYLAKAEEHISETMRWIESCDFDCGELTKNCVYLTNITVLQKKKIISYLLLFRN